MTTLKEIYFEQPVGKSGHPGNTDKETHHSYISGFYEEAFKEYKNKDDLQILEIGIAHGGSINLWLHYFDDVYITGVDLFLNEGIVKDANRFMYHERVNLVKKSGTDKEYIDTLEDDFYDIIIDDGSHKIGDQVLSLKYMYSKVKRGGLYIIEDIESIEATKQLEFQEGWVKLDLNKDRVEQNKKRNRYDNIIMYWKK